MTGPSSRAGLLAALLALGACTSRPGEGQFVGDIITSTDFENLAGWGADMHALTAEHAHSGRLATFIGPEREYSLTYHLPLGRASVHAIRAVELAAWVYLPSARADAALVVQVFRPEGGAPYYSQALPLLPEVGGEYEKWRPVHHIFELPTGLPAEAELRCYLWRGGSPEPAYLDDLTLKARE